MVTLKRFHADISKYVDDFVPSTNGLAEQLYDSCAWVWRKDIERLNLPMEMYAWEYGHSPEVCSGACVLHGRSLR